MKKYLLFLGVVFLFVGCGGIEQVEPNSKHSQILQKATACSHYSLQDAKDKATRKLSKQLISFVRTNTTSNKSFYNKQGRKTYYSFNKQSFDIGSAFLSITPKFIDNTKKESLFSDPTFCSTIIIDYDLLQQYIRLAKNDYNQVKNDIKTYNGKVSYLDRDKTLKEIINKDSSVINEYHKLYNVIKVFPVNNFQLPPKITVENMSKFLNTKPYVTIKKNNCLYNQKCLVEANIFDENPESVNLKWYIDNHLIKDNNPMIYYNFKRPGIHFIKVIATDNEGFKYITNKKVNLKNYAPTAKFRLNGKFLIKNKPLIIRSLAKDPENQLKYISYKLINLNNRYDTRNVFSKYRLKRVGKYLLVQNVKDKYNKKAKASSLLRVETKYRKRLYKNISYKQVYRMLGSAKRDERIGIFTISNYAYDYGDYWLLFYSDKLKCVVYGRTYVENKDCNEYSENSKSEDL